MKPAVLFLFTALLCSKLYAQQDNLTIYDQTGDERTFADIQQALQGKTHVFYGELHGTAQAHQMERKLLQTCDSLFEGKVILGMEMFEADVQPIVDEYLHDVINEKSFESETRIWDNYTEDYRPLVTYAKEKGIQVVASNVPRRYANMVYHRGVAALDSLSDWAKAFMAPLPLEIDSSLRSYQEMSAMMNGHQSANMVAAQAIKDATMAHFIAAYTQPDCLFLHVNGAYHTAYREGIIAYLRKEVEMDNILTITTVKKEDFEEDSDTALQKADFVVVIE